MQYANITVQLSIFLLLVVSLILKKKRNYVWHGNIMLLAIILNSLLLLSHMGPSLIYLVNEPFFITILGIIHVAIGSTAEILGVWITVTWAFGNSEIKYCAAKRKIMKKTLILWLATLALGLVFYVLHTIFE
jgi:uncharacterized membrane protein YozB (DUF420 family)